MARSMPANLAEAFDKVKRRAASVNLESKTIGRGHSLDKVRRSL